MSSEPSDNTKSYANSYLGDASSLKKHAMTDIEVALAKALETLTGQQLQVTVNNLQIHEVTGAQAFLGAKPKVTFDVCVQSKAEQVEAPF
jgi:autotransporter translocation and assembly factor TamB